MKRVLTAGATLAALLASYGWVATGGAIALIPGVLGALSGAIVTVLHRSPSRRGTVAGVAVAVGIVVTLIVLEDEVTLFFGAVVTISIVVTDLALGLWSRPTGK